MTSYTFKTFDMEKQLKLGATIVILARRGSGKSVLIKDIMYNLRKKIPHGTIISPTENDDPDFSDYFPMSYIYDKYDPAIIDQIYYRQMKIIDQMKKEKRSKKINPNTLFVMDDCAHDNKWVKDEQVRELFSNGRHKKITYVVAIQDALVLNPFHRGNVDFCMMLQENSGTTKERMFKSYANIFPNKKIFESVFDQITKDFGVMIIDNANRTSDIEKIVYKYRATVRKPGDFVFGHKKMWQYHKKYFNEEYMQIYQEKIQNRLHNKSSKGTDVHVEILPPS